MGKGAIILPMRRVLIGLLFFWLGVVILSMVFSPPTYWLWQWVGDPDDPFRRVFNRVLMVSALILAWPLSRYWKAASWSDLGLKDFKRFLPLWGQGFLLGVLSVGLLFALQILCGVRYWNHAPEISKMVGYLASGVAVGIFEEVLFRGLLFLLILRLVPGKPVVVLVLTSLFFASSHYLKAPDLEGAVGWSSGVSMWGVMLPEFLDATNFALRWVSLVLVGMVLCRWAGVSGLLWPGMGLHAGWVFALKSLNRATDWTGKKGSWWFQADILSGISADLVLVSMLILLSVMAARKHTSMQETSSP